MPGKIDLAPLQRGAQDKLTPAARLARAVGDVKALADPTSTEPWRSPHQIMKRAGVPLLGTDIVPGVGGISTQRMFYPAKVEGVGTLPPEVTGMGEVRESPLSGQKELVISTTVFTGNNGVFPQGENEN